MLKTPHIGTHPQISRPGTHLCNMTGVLRHYSMPHIQLGSKWPASLLFMVIMCQTRSAERCQSYLVISFIATADFSAHNQHGYRGGTSVNISPVIPHQRSVTSRSNINVSLDDIVRSRTTSLVLSLNIWSRSLYLSLRINITESFSGSIFERRHLILC